MYEFISAAARLGVVLSIASLFNGCHKHEHEHVDEHGHEQPRAEQVTVWGGDHEIFVEHPPVVAGQATRFAVHVTELAAAQPRRDGAIRFVLRQGSAAPGEHVESAPARPGIYEPALTFPSAGDWNVSLVIAKAAGDKRITLPAIKVFATQHEADQARVPELVEGISFLKEQQWRIGSRAESVAKRRLVERIKVPAIVNARPGSLAKVRSPVAGKLLARSGNSLPTIGEKVAKDDLLVLLQPAYTDVAARVIEADAEAKRTRLALDQAQLVFDRVRKLVQSEARSLRELQEAEFTLRTARANHDAALAAQSAYQLSAASTNGSSQMPAIEIRSPIAGVITDAGGAPLDGFVAADADLFTVLDASMVFVKGTVPEAGILRIGDARRAAYEIPGQGAPRDIEGGFGRFVSIGAQVDLEPRGLALVYEVNNSNALLRVGQRLTLHVETQRAEDALAVPESAIIEEGGQPIAFVQAGGETFQRRELALGLRDGEWVQVLSGLSAGERVVTKGAMAIRLAAASSSMPAHGHAH